MPSSPLRVEPPAGWTDIITNGGPTDGFAIQFKTSTDALAPGQSLDFSFSTPRPRSARRGLAVHPGFPVLTSAVFQGQPFQGDTVDILVTAVPEPSSLIQGALGVMACGGWGSAGFSAVGCCTARGGGPLKACEATRAGSDDRVASPDPVSRLRP